MWIYSNKDLTDKAIVVKQMSIYSNTTAHYHIRMTAAHLMAKFESY